MENHELSLEGTLDFEAYLCKRQCARDDIRLPHGHDIVSKNVICMPIHLHIYKISSSRVWCRFGTRWTLSWERGWERRRLLSGCK